MSTQHYAVSTLTNDVEYPVYGPLIPGAARVIERSIVIKGKAGLPNKHLLTPRGVVTPVTDEDIAALETNPVYLAHFQNGWVTIEKMDPRDADKVAADQNEKDGSAQKTAEDLAADGKAAKVKKGA